MNIRYLKIFSKTWKVKYFLVENEGKSVKKAVLAAESNIEEESISDENEELLHEGEYS